MTAVGASRQTARDKIEFLLDEAGNLRVVPVAACVTRLKGMVPKPTRVVSLDDMEAAIVRAAG